MKKIRLIAFACIASLLLVAIALPSPAVEVDARFAKAFKQQVTQVGPLDLAGELNGAPYRIRVPAVWNGTLLVFAHGYRDKADHPGDVDNRNADVAPSAATFPAALGFNHGFAPPPFPQP